MENSFQIKLICNIPDTKTVYSILEMMLEKLKVLQSLHGTMKQMELKLFEDASMLDSNGDPDKIAFFRMNSDSENIMEYSRSKRWDDALFKTIEKISDRPLHLNPLEKTA